MPLLKALILVCGLFFVADSTAFAQPASEAEAAQYCNSSDMESVRWMRENGPRLTPEQQQAAAINLNQRLSQSCQTYFNMVGERLRNSSSGGGQPQCTRRQIEGMIAWNGQGGPHRIRTDCWNFPQ